MSLPSCQARSHVFDAADTGKARLWDLGRKKTVRCFCPSPKEDNADIASVCHGENDFSDLVAVAYNTSVALFDVREPALVARKAAMSFHLHQDEVNHVAMSSLHGRTHLAAADDNGELLFYDLSAGKLLRRISGAHDNICASVVFRTGHAWQALSGGLDGKLAHWNYNKMRALATFHPARASMPSQNQIVNPRFVYGVACDGSGNRAAAALGDGTVAIYDLQTKHLVQELHACENMVNAVEWAPFAPADRALVLCGGSDGYVAAIESSVDVSSEDVAGVCLPELRDVVDALRVRGAEGTEADSSPMLKLMCSSQINSIACSSDGRVYVGDQGEDVLEFDLRCTHSAGAART